MNKLIEKENLKIEDMIYEIRGKQVMLDSDLAKLYGVETKRINEAVKNNPLKFPERFSFKLTDKESKNFLVENFDQKNNNIETRGGKYKNPRVFTEQGIAMLATILKSKAATETSIGIMDAFVRMRHFIIENKDVYKSLNNINNKIIDHDEKINYIFSKFNRKEQLFLPGETYDAYSKIIDILSETQIEVIIIDSYADKTVLDLVKNIASKIILITSNKSKLSNLEINKFNEQYNKLKVIKNDTFHDRYFIIDRNKVFHIGTSLNYAGKRLFSINKLEDRVVKENLLNYVIKILNDI